MELMKRSRQRLAVSLMTIIAMVFTLIPCMGADVANATTGDRTEVTGYATTANPIDKVIFEEQSDGNYKVYVHFDPSVYNKSHYKDIKGWVVFDGNTGRIHTGWSNDTVVKNNYTMVISTSVWNNSCVKPGETIRLAAGAYYDTYIENNTNEYKWVCLQNGKDYALASARSFTAPDPSGTTEKFNGFKVERDYYANGDFLGITVEYSSYSGASSDYARYDLYFREDVKSGTIQLIQEDTNYYNCQDTNLNLDREYTYYIVKRPVLEGKSLSTLANAQLREDINFDEATKTKLKKISAYASISTPEPLVVTAKNLKITTDIRKAVLSWNWEMVPGAGEPYVTGYTVCKYSNTGALLATYDHKSALGCMVTYSIPYTGTYFFQVFPYYIYNGKKYDGGATAKVSCASKQIKTASGSVTKISSTKARITINKSEASTGTEVYQYVGGKWKKLGSTTKNYYMATKNTAGKKKYKLRSYIIDGGKPYYAASYSSVYSPKANVSTYKYSNRPAAYKQLSHYWRPDKIYYSGKKVMVKGKFINTHIYTMKYFKIKLTVKCQGKVIGTKVIDSGQLKPNQVKKITVKLDKSKTGYDLRAGGLTWSYKTIKWY